MLIITIFLHFREWWQINLKDMIYSHNASFPNAVKALNIYLLTYVHITVRLEFMIVLFTVKYTMIIKVCQIVIKIKPVAHLQQKSFLTLYN